MDSVKEAGSAATTFQLEYDEEVAFTAKRRIFDYAKYRDLPFAMTVSFIHPHDPYVARPEFWDRYEGVEIDLPHLRSLRIRIPCGFAVPSRPPMSR